MGIFDSVKGIAAKVGDTVEKGAKNVSASSKKIAEKSKIKKEISTLEGDINSLYIEIGKKHFEEIAESPSEEFAESVESIKTKTERIEELKQALIVLEDKQTCSECGAEISKEQKFCDKCGAKIEQPVIPEILENDEVTYNPDEIADDE